MQVEHVSLKALVFSNHLESTVLSKPLVSNWRSTCTQTIHLGLTVSGLLVYTAPLETLILVMGEVGWVGGIIIHTSFGLNNRIKMMYLVIITLVYVTNHHPNVSGYDATEY